jgi:hypothetical protein
MVQMATGMVKGHGHLPPGCRFARRLGTGHGRTFTPGDADPRHWALLACWDSPEAAAAYAGQAACRAWDARADERWTLRLQPLSSTGRWSGHAPFGAPTTQPDDRPVAVLTRARIALRHLRRFHRSVPPVATRLAAAPGLRFARGIGEAPIGLQATLSVWDDLAAARAFAYATNEHQKAIRRTHGEGWFTESLFARFAVVDSEGTVDGSDPLARPAAHDRRATQVLRETQWGDRP